LPVLEKYILTLFNGAIDFVRPQGYLFGWASATFLKIFFLKIACTLALRTHNKKEPGKKLLVLRFTQVCPCIRFTQVCPCIEKIEIACSFAIHVGKRERPRKIYFSLGVDCHPHTT
jgi:hypothetical protein